MNTQKQPQCPPQHISGNRHTNEPPQHGINIGSGNTCLDHSYSNIDDDGNAVKRDESLTEILISKGGIQEVNLISAIVALGEGECFLYIYIYCSCSSIIKYDMSYVHKMN